MRSGQATKDAIHITNATAANATARLAKLECLVPALARSISPPPA